MSTIDIQGWLWSTGFIKDSFHKNAACSKLAASSKCYKYNKDTYLNAV